MTRERALELADNLANDNDFHDDLRGDIAETILAAVGDEREECAKIADTMDRGDRADSAAHIARLIRDRGAKGENA